MYLVDTDVISEARKGEKANPGVKAAQKTLIGWAE
jgi:predicted nucleic acid-binding protein